MCSPAPSARDHSNKSVEHALDLAEQFGSMVHALFVFEQTEPSDHWDFEIEEQEAAGEAALDTVAAVGDERGVDIERYLRRGIPSEEIVDAATEWGLTSSSWERKAGLGFPGSLPPEVRGDAWSD